MILVKTNAQIDEDRRKKEAEKEPVQSSYVTMLGSHIRKCWSLAEEAKKDVQERMLENQRQKEGMYSTAQLAEIKNQGGSEIFRRSTATKCMGAIGWITDVMMPFGDKPWSIDPTPEPEIPVETQLRIVSETTAVFQQMQMQGVEFAEQDVYKFAAQLRDEIARETMKEAKKRADRMAKRIADQLTEGGFDKAFSEFVEDIVVFPAGVFKGPVFRKKKLLKPSNGKILVTEKLIPEFERVSPLDFYPAPDANSVDDAFVIEKQRFTRGELYNLIGVPGYDEAAIRRVLQMARSGAIIEDTLSGGGNSERAEAEGKESAVMSGDESDIVDGFEFWGRVPGSMLTEWELEGIEDQEKEYEIWAVMIKEEVIKAELNPDPIGRRPYYVTSFEKVAGNIWGKGVPDKMQDTQRMQNALWRSLCNNLAIASGPQCMVNNDKLVPGEKITSIRPFKIWTYRDHGNNAAPPIAFFQPDINAGELLSIHRTLKEETDEDTGIPRYIYGDEKVGGAGRTATGLSMLMNASSKGIRRVLRNIDSDAMNPVISAMYYHNMLYSDDESIKGDMCVRSRGVLAMIVREQANQDRREFLAQTNNPVDGQIIGIEGRAKLLREIARTMELPEDLIPDDEEIRMQIQQAAQLQQQEAQMSAAEGMVPAAAVGQ